MNRRYRLRLLIAVMAVTVIMLGFSTAFAGHVDQNIDVKLYKWNVISICSGGLCSGGSKDGQTCASDNDCVGYVIGTDIVEVTSATDAYSPRATCTRACHTNDGDSVVYDGHLDDYGSGLKMSVHTHGVKESDNQIYWQAYETKAFEHGVSIGRHYNHGRNEDYSYEMRETFGDPWFTSSPGMFGKY